jgi:CRISPR/Cas system Type II protein with McrA/HNH and RuvC-like nuclease domain
MKKILGLDLGTTSIGWAFVKEAENETEQSSIEKVGVRVNPLTTDEQTDFEKGKSVSSNADRTLKRGARRNLDRYKLIMILYWLKQIRKQHIPLTKFVQKLQPRKLRKKSLLESY